MKSFGLSLNVQLVRYETGMSLAVLNNLMRWHRDRDRTPLFAARERFHLSGAVDQPVGGEIEFLHQLPAARPHSFRVEQLPPQLERRNALDDFLIVGQCDDRHGHPPGKSPQLACAPS